MKGFINLTHTNNSRVDRKIDKLATGSYVIGNIPKINSNGELEDSGYNRLIQIVSDLTTLGSIEFGFIMLYIGTDTTYNGYPVKSNKIYEYQVVNIGSHDNIILDNKFVEVLDYLTSDEITTIVNDINSDINEIKVLIPEQASSTNQLADKDFVNSSISSSTATYKGNYNLINDLNLTISATHNDIATALLNAIQTADNNDYCFVQIPTGDLTPTIIAQIDRYKYNGSAWSYEYTLNNSGFTASQWAAINSGATSTNISDIANKVDKSTTIAGVDLQDNITTTELQTALSDSTHRFVTDAEKNTYNNKANINYVDNKIQTSNVTFQTSDWTALTGNADYSYYATITLNNSFDANDIVELINNDITLFNTYGFAIYSITSNIMTIYAKELPTQAVTLYFQINKALPITIQQIAQILI